MNSSPALFLALLLSAGAALAGEAEYAALVQEGKRLFEAREYARAAEIARQAVGEAARTFGPRHPTTLQIMDKYALTLSASLQYDESNKVYRQILELAEKAGALESAATTINNIAGNYTRQARHAEAIEWTRKALAIREKLHGPEHEKTAEILNYLAIELRRIGKYEEAEALQRKVLAIWERTRHPNLVYALGNLAGLLSDTGRYGEAEPYYRRALEMAEGRKGFEAGAAMVQANYAAALGELGKHAEAEALLRRSLAFRERSLGASHFGVAQTLRNLAASVQAQDKHAEAETLLRRALKILESTQGADPADLGKVRHGLAVTLSAQGRHVEAQPFAQAALQGAEKLLGPGHPDTAERMRAYARTLLAGGRREEALRLYLGAAEILKKAGKPRALLVASADIATILHASGLLEQALPHYRDAIDALDYLFAQTRGLDEQSRYSFLGQYAQVYRNMLELLLELNRRQPGGNHAREALAVASRNQSRIFSELLRAADVARIAKNVGFAALKKERDGTADELAALRGSAATLPPTEFNVALKKRNLENRIAEMERQLAGLDARLWKEYPRYMELARPRAVTVEEIQKRLLKPGDALLSYVLLPGETAIFAVTRERFALIARPLPRDEAARLVSAVRTPAEDLAISGNLKALTNLDPADLHALYRELIQPAEPTLKGANKVLVVGDGPINTLPFEMLVTRYDEGAKRAFAAARGEHTGSRGKPLLGEYAGLAYLGSQYRFAYLPSLAALASQRLHAKPPVKYDRELVSFADPIFEQEGGQTYNEATRSALNRLAASRSLRSGGASVGLSRLQETADEAREIARTLGGRHDIYLREQAQEATVKSIDLKTTRYLHFATHGLLGGEFLQVQQALPAPSPDKGPRTSLRNLAVAEKPAQASFPPTRPGTAAAMGQPALALTLVGTAGGEDGLLTMGEVLESLDLNAQVVVLSACNTAGETTGGVGGEGFAGLTRAFMYAGAKSLVVSHWAVDSVSTQELMSEAFRQVKAGKVPIEAMQLARQFIFKSRDGGGKINYSREHPYFWAPFVYVGD